MTLNVSVVSVMRVVAKRLRLELLGFRYKVVLKFSYLYVKFDDEIKWEFLRISSIISASLRPKLNWRLYYAIARVYF